MRNLLTVDVEDIADSRYAAAAADRPAPDRQLLETSVCLLLETLARHNAGATFFVLGAVAEAMPGLVRRIREAGHEIASHGYSHRLLYTMTPREFKSELERSRKALEDASGERVLGFRAPYWSVTERSLWALEIVAACGLQYDSSISPSVNFLYGMRGASRRIYRHELGFWEVPPTTWSLFGRPVIVGGGFYLRALPYWFTAGCFRAANDRAQPGLAYLHPHELVNGTVPGSMSAKEDFILHFHKRSFRPKLERLLGDFSFGSIRDVLAL